MPVKNAPYRLFVNQVMMKGGKTALGETVTFEIEQDTCRLGTNYTNGFQRRFYDDSKRFRQIGQQFV